MVEVAEQDKHLYSDLGISDAVHESALRRVRATYLSRSSLTVNGPARSETDNPTVFSHHEIDSFHKAIAKVHADRECFMAEPPEGITAEFLIREGILSGRLSTHFLHTAPEGNSRLPVNRLLDLDILSKPTRTTQSGKKVYELDLGELWELANIVVALQTAGFIPGPPCVQMEMITEARAVLKRAGYQDDQIEALQGNAEIGRAARILSSGKPRSLIS